MLQALNTGHEGSLVTLHSNSCDDAIHRLATLASMSELQIPFEALRDQINSAIDVIVQVDRFADGGRRVSEVAVVASAPPRELPAGIGDARSRPTRSARTGKRHRRLRAPPAAGPGPRRHLRLQASSPSRPPFGPAAEAATTPERKAVVWRRTPRAALLLLLFVLGAGVLGLWLLLTGSCRSAELAERGRGGNDDAAVRACVRRSTSGFAAHAERPPARRTGCRARARRSRRPSCRAAVRLGRCS